MTFLEEMKKRLHSEPLPYLFARWLIQNLPDAKSFLIDRMDWLVFRFDKFFLGLQLGQGFGCRHAQGQAKYE